ncbi:universal stress protein [Solihabitans fulvus]|uniref:Universal stress protein n=1 Tax=Solihabitans fulvus TaxID=1892852 RepID=A0A5B2XFF0_9PSEU|nr:universal stress protein [Solihabitans fulvus]KAA2261854.1 universal stress protein [Solihabitans fulvus]
MNANNNEDRERIVVGVDGSPASTEALRWALEEAARRDAVVDAVIAWQSEPQLAGPQPVLALPYQQPEKIRDEHAEVLSETVTKTGVGDENLGVLQHVIAGWAPKALVDHARGASLLVVGSHGHSWITEKLLGTVSAYCVRHAPCPVVIIPAHTDADQQPDPAADEQFVVGPAL